jgi:hypothetical protein
MREDFIASFQPGLRCSQPAQFILPEAELLSDLVQHVARTCRGTSASLAQTASMFRW